MVISGGVSTPNDGRSRQDKWHRSEDRRRAYLQNIQKIVCVPPGNPRRGTKDGRAVSRDSAVGMSLTVTPGKTSRAKLRASCSP